MENRTPKANMRMKRNERQTSETPSKIITRRQSVRLLKSPHKTPDSDGDPKDEVMEIDNESTGMSYFKENPDVHSQQTHEFKTTKKKDGMLTTAHNTPKTPKTPKFNSMRYGTPTTKNQPKNPKTPTTPKTPKSTLKLILPKTPNPDRSKFKKAMKRTCRDADEEDDDFSGDSSDGFAPSESSESDDDSDEKVSSSSPDDDKHLPIVSAKHSATKLTRKRNMTNSKNQQQDLIFESDKYFGQTNKKNATSNNTLDNLKTPRLQHEELFKLLAITETSVKHQQCINEMQCQYETLFPKWLFILKEGYSIVLYGLGSKRNILQQLHSNHLAKENVLVVNGYFPSLTIKEILDNVAELIEMTCRSKNVHEIVDAIAKEMTLSPDYYIFIIIHNLDGAMLRNELAQTVLSRLANVPNIHLIASIDHINTPQLWDNIQLSNYKFSWWDTTSFMPYADETSVVENSMLVKNSGALAISSMKSVFLSLTPNARGVYMIIAKNQLANNKSSNFQGMPFKNLYKKCLEAFLVSSDVVLRTILTEFYDHNLLKFKRSVDGTDQLKITIDNILLQQFVEQHDN